MRDKYDFFQISQKSLCKETEKKQITIRPDEDTIGYFKSLAEEKGIPFPYLFDESQNTAREYDAVCTPDIYVYGEGRKLLYRGRIDDNWERPEMAAQRDLRDAIHCVLDGREVNGDQVSSMGCSIKWK